MTMRRPALSTVDLAKAIAQGFVTRWAADEYPYFSVLWSSVTAAWRDKRESPLAERPYWQTALEGLGFAREARLTLQSPFVMISALSILDELNAGLVAPDAQALERGIVACAKEIGSSERQAQELGRKLAPLILQQWQELQADRQSESSPSETSDVVVSVSSQGLSVPDGRSVAPKKQQLQLLIHLLREQNAHWSDGYVLFDLWTRSTVKNPRRQFEVVCSRLNEALAQVCAGLRVVRSKGVDRDAEYWRLEIPPLVSLVGDVVTARKETETATMQFGNTDFTGALACAGAALEKDTQSGQAIRMFLRALDNVSGTSAPAEQLQGIHRSLLKQSIRLENAVAALDAMEKAVSGALALEDLSDARQRLRLRLNEINFLFKRLQARLQGLPPPPKEQQAFDQFIDAVRRYRTTEKHVQEEAFREMTSTAEVQRLITEAARYAAKCLRVRQSAAEAGSFVASHLPTAEGKRTPLDEVAAPESKTGIVEDRYVLTRRDVLNTVYQVLGKAVMTRYEATDFATLTQGVHALRRLVTQGAVEALIETGYGITPQQQQDMRRMRSSIKKQGARAETRVSDEPVELPKGWDRDRWDFSVRTESILSDKIDMQAYYRLYRRKARSGQQTAPA